MGKGSLFTIGQSINLISYNKYNYNVQDVFEEIFFLFFKIYYFLLLFNYSCRPFLPVPPPPRSWTHLPPPPSPPMLSRCPL